MKKIDYLAIKDYLIQAVLADTGLQLIACHLAEQLGYPIIYIDKQFHVLFHSDPAQIKDFYWQNSIASGSCSYEFISTVQQLSAFQKGKKQDAFFELTCPIDSSTKWIKPITLTPNHYGYLIALKNQSQLSAQELEILGLFSQIIRKEGKKNPALADDSPTDSVILSYLDGSAARKQKEAFFLRQKNKLQGPFRLLFLSLLSYDIQKDSRSILRQKLLATFPQAKILFYQESLLLLLENQNQPFVVSEAFTYYLSKSKLHLIIGDSFRQIEQIKPQYERLLQTESFLSPQNFPVYGTSISPENQTNLADSISFSEDFSVLTPSTPPLIWEQDYSLWHLFAYLEKKGKINHFLLPEIFDLAEHDKKYNTSYLPTLKAYLQCHQNRIETAKSLYIHRNTLQYRLRKMREDFHLPLEKPAFVLNALVSISYLDYRRRDEK
ncbi:PucR family transcriptional regulator [Clostridiales bacterium COT073_COT-073]|nr:PucR family transcriptional regulator [Clostridiales bacterium COT073_COT-073]